MRDGRPDDPLHDALIAAHYELCEDRRKGERRVGERRVEPGGIAAVAGLDRRREERRDGDRRRPPSEVTEGAYRALRARTAPGVQAA